ncbi:MAG: branched-chain amino acid transaminase [Candidatus Paceibacterota bacterium]
MQNVNVAWYNGKLIPIQDAKINILSPCAQFGTNIFEGIRGYWNDKQQELYCFRLDRHYKRLKESAKIMRFEMTYGDADFKDALFDVLKANQFKEDIQIRHIVFIDGSGSWYSTGPVGMFVYAKPGNRSFGGKRGIDCCVSSWERINDASMPPRIKAGSNYQNSRMVQLEAVANGYDSAIILNKFNKVSEGPGSCIFMVRNNQLVTPPVTAGILESVTRDTIMELAESELNIKVCEREIDRTELYVAEEVFLCGTAMEITPVLNIDKIPVGNKEPGSITNELFKTYFQIVRGERNDHMDWLTPVYGKMTI